MLRLRQLREKKHINQQKLAMELNITQAAISKYELGLSEPDINMLKAISNYFGVSVDYLIGNSDKTANYTKADLSDEEILLINSFKNLDTLQKEKLFSYIDGLSGK